ncbi:MAG: heavy-metal-associated domain-containing protein [Flavobacteriales bacterium]|nr:heavy-metal-associated domain-containing protein [Flavobacteriales bacterium]
MPILHLHVDNLKCGGCASTIRHRVQELAGVTSVRVDPEAGSVDVDHDGTTKHDQVAALLMRLGYPEHGTGGALEKAKSFISCAIGRVKGED